MQRSILIVYELMLRYIISNFRGLLMFTGIFAVYYCYETFICQMIKQNADGSNIRIHRELC